MRQHRGETLLAVADGMGGMAAGERASALAIAACERPPQRSEAPEQYLRSLVQSADEAIRSDVAAHPGRAGMGSTLVLALVRDGAVHVAHVGDSRAYLWRDGQLQRLTLDHSVTGELVRDGRLAPAAARSDSRRHLLTRALGGRHSNPDFGGSFALGGRSVLLLVSDGVCGVIDDHRIAEAVRRYHGVALAQQLVNSVYENGAPDNVAIALADERS